MSNINDLGGPANLWRVPKTEPTRPLTLTWADLGPRYSRVVWLYEGYIAQGFATMIAGPPGMGKSFLTMAWCKILMYGGTWPDGTVFTQPIEDAMILWVETEGGEPLNIPRAEKMGIDLSRISTIHTSATEGNGVDLLAKDDLDRITSVASHKKVVAIVIDSLSGGHNTNENETGAGKVVQKVSQLAAKHNIPLLLTHHVNKKGFGTDAPSMEHVRGSGSQLQYVRIAVQLDCPDPRQPDAKRITCIKNNLSRIPEPLGFEMSETGPVWCDAPMPQHRERKSENRTLRDTKVLEMVRSGVSYRKISESLGISPATISNIVNRANYGTGSSDDADETEQVGTPPNEPVDPVSGTDLMESALLFSEAPS